MAHVDQLLEEYLRVINSKDNEIHELIRCLEKHRCESRKKEEVHKADAMRARQELEKMRKKLRKMEQGRQKYEEDINRLVNHNESTKLQMEEMQRKLAEAAKTAVEVRQEQARDLEEVRRQHSEELRALRAERDQLKSEQLNLRHEQEAVRKAMEACEAKEHTVNAREAINEELKKSITEMQRKVESMVPAQQHMDALAKCEDSLRSQKANAAAEIDDLKAQLSKSKRAACKYRDEVDNIKKIHAQLQQELNEATLEREKTCRELDAEREAGKRLLAAQQRDVELAHEATKKVTTQLEAALGQVQCSENKTKTLEARLVEVSEALEQERGRGRQECERISLQLKASEMRLAEQKLEVERMQRKLDSSLAELKECHAAISNTKEEALRSNTEIKEKLALTCVERDRIREERDRVVFELKDTQHQLNTAQEQLKEDKRTLLLKIEDANITIDRMKDQLRDKEHQHQMLMTALEKRLQEDTSAHKNELNECKKTLGGELSHLRQRLDSTNERLLEESANNKACQRDLQLAHETLRSSREECERRASEGREIARALEETKRELTNLREEVAKRQQRLDGALESEARLQRTIEHIERDRAAEARRCESLAASLADAKEEIAAKRDEALQLRHELARAREEITKGESVETVARLRESQGRVEQLERDLANMQQERQHQLASMEKLREAHEAAEKIGRDAKEELCRLHAELQQKTSDTSRVSHHAKKVKDLARRSCEELERELSRRDATITSLQQEALRLADERAKVALLEERLSHQADLSLRDAEASRQRIALLEKELDACNAQLQQQVTAVEEMATQLRTVQDRAEELEKAVAQKHKKHALRKEALRRALEQVDAATERRAEAEEGLGKVKMFCETVVEPYKTEIHRLQEQLRAAREAQQSAETRLATQDEAIRSAGDAHEIQQQQLAKMREERGACIAKYGEELRAALEQSDALSRELAQARQFVREVEEEKSKALQSAKDAQRCVTALYNRLASKFVEDAIMTKEMFGDFAVAVTTRSCYQLAKMAYVGWDIAVSFKQKSSEEMRQQQLKMQHEMDELKRGHANELQVALDERNKELSKLALQHGTDIAHLRQEIVDATERLSLEREASLKDYRRKEEQFHRDKTELECAKLEIAHQADQIVALKEQLRGFEQRSETERTILDQEKRTLQQQQERIRRRLDDCTMEQNQSEVEVRELRTELTAMQNLLKERESALESERQRARQESHRLATLTATKETLHTQLEELRRQVLVLRQQLSVARQGAQQSNQAAVAQQTRTEERVAELTKAINAVGSEKRRLERQLQNDEKKIGLLERELAESRKREAELSSQLQARKAENSALKERCANLESLKNISELTLSETRVREKALLGKMEEMRSAQQLMQLCFDKQQEQLEVGRRMHEQDINRSGCFFRDEH